MMVYPAMNNCVKAPLLTQILVSQKKFSGNRGVLCPKSGGFQGKTGNHGPLCPNSRDGKTQGRTRRPAGADLYTTSKLLGHTNITTTQIYAEVVDEKKSRAVRLMDGLL